jgi:hypothetical protein
MYTFIYVYIHIYTCMYIYLYIYVYILTCIHTCIYISTHTYIGSIVHDIRKEDSHLKHKDELLAMGFIYKIKTRKEE